MNVQDFPDKFDKTHISQTIELVFNKQHQLASKYSGIERRNGFYYPESGVCNLNLAKDQALLKSMAWRCVEEIGESLEAEEFSKETNNVKELENQKIHIIEELVDGLHFITELCILSGLNYVDFYQVNILLLHKDIDTDYYSYEKYITNFIKSLGISMNHLKNKPWKQSMKETDKKSYLNSIINCYIDYLKLLLSKMPPLTILNLYFKKSEVNSFRIRSNY